MAIIDRQRRLVEVGKIRVGEKSEKGFPQKREEFRFTSQNEEYLKLLQGVYGGVVRPWAERPGEYELLSNAKTIKVLFSASPLPDGDYESLSDWYELWGGNTCKRRCNGEICQIWEGEDKVQKPCQCDRSAANYKELAAKGKACHLATRMKVMLADVPTLGMWRLTTGSKSFSAEVHGLIETIINLGVGPIIPLTATIEIREKRTGEGKATSKFPVVKLELDTNPKSLPALIQDIKNKMLAMPSSAPVSGIGELTAPTAVALPAVTAVIVDEDEDQIEMTEDQMREFKTWCEGEGIKNPEMALKKAMAEGCDTVESVYEFLRGYKQLKESEAKQGELIP